MKSAIHDGHYYLMSGYGQCFTLSLQSFGDKVTQHPPTSPTK